MNNKGISMIEVLVSMLVLCIGLLGVAPMVVLSIKGNTISRDTISTSKYAKEKIEYLESLESIPAVPYEYKETSDNGVYDLYMTINNSTTDNTIPIGLYEVNITISWQDEMKHPKQVSYSTYLRKGPIHEGI